MEIVLPFILWVKASGHSKDLNGTRFSVGIEICRSNKLKLSSEGRFCVPNLARAILGHLVIIYLIKHAPRLNIAGGVLFFVSV